MAIKLNLDRVMEARGISLTDLASRIGITLANLSILKTNKARAIRFTTLEALCRELKCQPGELLGIRRRPARARVRGRRGRRMIRPMQPQPAFTTPRVPRAGSCRSTA